MENHSDIASSGIDITAGRTPANEFELPPRDKRMEVDCCRVVDPELDLPLRTGQHHHCKPPG